MDQRSTKISHHTDVEADLLYLGPMAERPHHYTYDLSLDREGFELVTHRTALRDFYANCERSPFMQRGRTHLRRHGRACPGQVPARRQVPCAA